MKTNEAVKRQLLSQAEEAIEVLLAQIEEIQTGDFQHLEHKILENVMELGRRSMETILASAAREEPVPVPKEGRCGHALKRAGEREKTVITLMGQSSSRERITIARKRSREKKRLRPSVQERSLSMSSGDSPADRPVQESSG